MNARRRTLLALAVLVIAGLLRLPAEHGLARDFRGSGLLPEPLELDLKEQIGQNGTAIALAGLQTLVATFTNLQATEHYSRYAWDDPRMEKAWRKVEDSMNTTVRLAPRGTYYWDMGAYHTAYNASSWVRNESGLPPLRAKAEALRWVEKGRDFHRRGIARNPDNWELPYRLGQLLSSPFHFPDDEAAAAAFRQALAVEGAPPSLRRRLLFAEARSGKDPAGKLAEVRALLREPGNRVPTLLCLAYTLEYQMNEPEDPLDLALAIFGSEEKALRNLGDYHVNGLVYRWPETGVEAAVRRLERRNGISPEDPASALRRKEELRRNRELLGL
jgi:hypothetical protein